MILKWLCYNKSMLGKYSKKGFTLVELSLSMLFVGILSLAIVLIINNTVVAYQRGLTLGRINTVGSDLVDDMRSSVQSSSARGLMSSCYMAIYGEDGRALNGEERAKCANDNARNFVSVTKTTKTLKINGVEVDDEVPIYGAFCTGSYSYVWNSGYYWAENATFDEKDTWAWVDYTDYSEEDSVLVRIGQSEDQRFRLIKLYDARRLVCAAAGIKNDGTGTRDTYAIVDMSNVFRVSSLSYGVIRLDDGAVIEKNSENIMEVKTSTIDLLPADRGNDLAIYDLSIAKPAISTTGDNVFYSATFILGTVHNGVNIAVNGSACATPNDYDGGNYNYCAINKFNFAMQVNGG